MKTILTMILAFAASTMSAQMLTRDNAKLDTLCQTKFTAVYQYSINTADADGKPVTDSIRLTLQVGDGVWKTWTYERYLFQQQRDEEIGEDHFWFMHNEALMHIATTTVGYPEGKTISLESIPPLQYEVMKIQKCQHGIWWKEATLFAAICARKQVESSVARHGMYFIPKTFLPQPAHGNCMAYQA